MNIKEAKQIRLVEYLRIAGHHPVNVRGYQYWYLSPLRRNAPRLSKSMTISTNGMILDFLPVGTS